MTLQGAHQAVDRGRWVSGDPGGDAQPRTEEQKQVRTARDAERQSWMSTYESPRKDLRVLPSFLLLFIPQQTLLDCLLSPCVSLA